MGPQILATLVSAALIAALYVVLRSFSVDDGDALDHACAWVVAIMLYMAWFRLITRK